MALKKEPRLFGELLDAVQPATRAAVKSALGKGRERGEFSFDGQRYWLKKKETKAPKTKKPRSGKERGKAKTGKTEAVTSAS